MLDLAKQSSADNKAGSAIALAVGLRRRALGGERRDRLARSRPSTARATSRRPGRSGRRRLLALLLVVLTGLVTAACSC